MVDKYRDGVDAAAAPKLCQEADMYAITHHWYVGLVPYNSFTIYQPWLKGYSGENTYWAKGSYYARYWIDQDLKKAMGR
jgi:hypothetical protein